MELIYDVKDKPKFSKNVVFALQQIFAIMAATLVVPVIVSSAGLQCDPAAALCGAGLGTIVYLLFTKFKSPVFLGSSFTFLGALQAVALQNYGYWGLIIGVGFAGLVYVIIAIIIKFVGAKWLNKLLPNIIIGPILAIIGLSLSGSAGSWVMYNGANASLDNYSLWYVVVGLFTFFMIVFASCKGSKGMKLIPFIVGIVAGFVLALILTGFGYINETEACLKMRIVDFTAMKNCFSPVKFTSFFDYPKFTFLEAIRTNGTYTLNGAAIGNLAVLFIPIAVVELAQHISDHKNISSIIGKDVLQDPGLDKTLLGDGVGSMVGAFFGGCANTTYGESIGCVALTRNASTWTILYAGIGAILISFVSPFVALINMLPKAVIGGACIALYGFISVSGLNMLRSVDLNDHKNLYPVAAILVIGVGGIALKFGKSDLGATPTPVVEITALAVALIVGILTNLFTHRGEKIEDAAQDEGEVAKAADEENVVKVEAQDQAE